MNEWYRWNTEAEAQACLAYINAHPSLPLVGNNAKTHAAQPDKTQTTKWCNEVTACEDGKFGFPRVTQTYLDAVGVDSASAQQFLGTFQPTIEEFDSAWLPPSDL